MSASRWTFSVHRQSAAACVSLSKSTMSKTRAAQRPHPFSARCRRRRLSIQPRIPCQTVFFKTVRTNPPETPEGKTSRPRRPSKEARQSSQERISKKLFEDLRKIRPNSFEPLSDLPEPRLLKKEKIRVNREFRRISASLLGRILHRTLEFLSNSSLQ